MAAIVALVGSPPAIAAVTAALLWPAAIGFPTWPALARGRLASTVGISLGVGSIVFALAQRFTAPPPL